MRQAETPRFSVVIPCYNEASFIGETLKSLQKQDTIAPYEIIVVDNNCTDETISIARLHGARIVNQSIPGVVWARQAGTHAAKGQIVVSTDADSVFSKNWLSNIDNYFKRQPYAVAVGGPCRYKDGPWWGKIYTHFLFGAVYLFSGIKGRPFYITATNIAFKKSAWDSYDLSAMQGGDELGLIHDLRSKGKIGFMNGNTIYTSGRRLQQGLMYNVFVSFLFYYLGAFYINKLFNRTVIGSAPAFRGNFNLQFTPRSVIGLGTVLAISVAVFVTIAPVRGFLNDNVRDTSSAVYSVWRDLT